MEYRISSGEIARRERAYLTLSTSIMVGLVLASLILKFPMAIGGYLLVITILLIIGLFSRRFFHNLQKVKIILSSSSLVRMIGTTTEEYSLANVQRVIIKWTTRQTIREIYMRWRDGRRVFVTALDRGTEFKSELLGKLDSRVVVTETHEPLDFDHPLFYSLLGLPISGVGVLVLQAVLSMNYQQGRVLSIASSVFLIIFGLYFLAVRPLSQRSGPRTVAGDYILAAFMIGSGIIFLGLSMTIL